MKINVTGEDWVNLPTSGFLSDSDRTTRESDMSIKIGFTNSDLNFGPLTIRHKSVKDLAQTIANIKQSLDVVAKSAMSVIKETRT